MNNTQKILSDFNIYSKYASYIPEERRRETWDEIVDRSVSFHKSYFPTFIHAEIDEAFEYVRRKEVLPSMRALQFAGHPIKKNNARIYNCSFLHIDSVFSFSEFIFLLLSGCGVGYSVQRRHTSRLPLINRGDGEFLWIVGDSIEGWADAVNALLRHHFHGLPLPVFDFSEIRPKGSRIMGGNFFAPGHEGLKKSLENSHRILSSVPVGERPSPIVCHDVLCVLADCVISGGIRRSACISLFDMDDEEMMNCKSERLVARDFTRDESGEVFYTVSGVRFSSTPKDYFYDDVCSRAARSTDGNFYIPWYWNHVWRARANNSVVLKRGETSKEFFFSVVDSIRASLSGEPGIFWTNDYDWGTNPCLFEDTPILTESGVGRISDFLGRFVKVMDFNGVFRYALVKKSGKRDFLSIKAGPVSVHATADHVWPAVRVDELGNPDKKTESVATESLYGYALISRYGLPSTVVFLESERLQGFSAAEDGFPKDADCVYGKTLSFLAGVVDYWLSSRSEFKFDETVGNFVLSFVFNAATPHFLSIVSFVFFSLGISGDWVLRADTNSFVYVVSRPEVLHFFVKRWDCRRLNFYDDFVNAYAESSFPETGFYYLVVDSVTPSFVSAEAYDLILSDSSNDESWFYTGFAYTHNCGEVALRSRQFCNLSVVNGSIVESQEHFERLARAAAFIGTLQACYDDFGYIGAEWAVNCDKERLLGVSITGIASGRLNGLDKKAAARAAVEENARVSKLLGISPAARVTLIKPEGTSSLVLGTSSGIHAFYSPYYLRRVRINKDEPVYDYVKSQVPDLLEDDVYSDNTAVLSLPVKSPDGALFRDEGALSMLERIKEYYVDWVLPGHRSGENTHNISCTVSVKDDEWDVVADWMWENRDYYSAISLLPYDSGTYRQAPFEECDEATFLALSARTKELDFSLILEERDFTNRDAEIACGGGKCEI